MRAPLLLALCACLPDPVLVSGDTDGCAYMPPWFLDADGDGHGSPDPEDLVLSCTAPQGYVAQDDDCDDARADVWEGQAVWIDEDGDGYGLDNSEVLVCGEPGAGQAAQGGDCDDADATVYAGAEPICGDGKDNNCDAQTDCGIPEGEIAAASTDGALVGDAADELGVSLAVVGDVTGDGYDDVAIGMPRAEGTEVHAGQALVVPGPMPDRWSLDEAVSYMGDESFDDAGRVVAAGGDLDGDDIADLAVGARLYGSASEGAVYVIYGPLTSGGLLSEAGSVLLGESPAGLAGSALAGGEDLLDEDGVAELVVGEPGYSSGAGAAWMVEGPVPAAGGGLPLIANGWTSSSGGQLGSALDHLGDVDGDGVPELAIAAPGALLEAEKRGAVYLLPANADAGDVADVALGWVLGTYHDGMFGLSLAGAGDVDDDGAFDLLVGAPEAEANGVVGGAVFLLLGADLRAGTGGVVGTDVAVHATLGASGAGDLFGYSVAGIGDMDAEGSPDLCAGAPRARESAGALFCWYGPVEGALGAQDADFVVIGGDGDERLGASVEAASDLNGLGVPDLLIGAPGELEDWELEGNATVYLLLGDGL